MYLVTTLVLRVPRVIFATVEIGMGVNIPDVRHVDTLEFLAPSKDIIKKLAGLAEMANLRALPCTITATTSHRISQG